MNEGNESQTGNEQVQQPYQQQVEKASGMAIAALVLGILSFCCGLPFSIAAWVIGHMERNNIKNGVSSQAGMGMATTGWILGIVVTILNILGGIIYVIIMIFGMVMSSGSAGF